MNDCIKFIDLFAGLSGTRIGFEAGCKANALQTKCVFTSDIKSASKQAHMVNFPGEDMAGDITKIDGNSIPDFDVLLAGFPCQPFSKAGMRRGFNDTRGTLFFDIARIVNVKKPKGMLLENVENFARHDSGNTLKVVVRILEELGYFVSYKVLDSSIYGGVPQKRNRIYIVADKNAPFDFNELDTYGETTFKDIREYGLPVLDNDFSHKLIEKIGIDNLAGKQIIDKRGGINVIHSWDFGMLGDTTSQQRQLLEEIRKNIRKRKFAEELGIRWRDGMPLNIEQIKTFIDYSGIESDLEYLSKCGYLVKQYPYYDDSLEENKNLPIGYKNISGRLMYEINRILSDDDQCVTLTATDSHKIGCLEKNGIRNLSIRECLRLFGFPEWYSLEGIKQSSAYDLIGNSIVVPVVENIVRHWMSKKP